MKKPKISEKALRLWRYLFPLKTKTEKIDNTEAKKRLLESLSKYETCIKTHQAGV